MAEDDGFVLNLTSELPASSGLSRGAQRATKWTQRRQDKVEGLQQRLVVHMIAIGVL